jgi:PIN domain nuclease of toxin-antitoxin system
LLLLDTHALLWLVRDDPMAREALDAVEAAQDAGALYASAITAWELGVAELKCTGRPALGTAPGVWFRQALRRTGARRATITPAIAAEAASVPATYGRGDPGDCFLIATARLRRWPLVTRDALILQLAAARPSYVQVLEC